MCELYLMWGLFLRCITYIYKRIFKNMSIMKIGILHYPHRVLSKKSTSNLISTSKSTSRLISTSKSTSRSRSVSMTTNLYYFYKSYSNYYVIRMPSFFQKNSWETLLSLEQNFFYLPLPLYLFPFSIQVILYMA